MNIKKISETVENVFIFLLVLLIFPFPKIIEEILIISIFLGSLLFCFFKNMKKYKIIEIYAEYLPTLILEIMLLQIHSIRFSLIANINQDQLIFVRLMQWISEKCHFSEIIIYGALLYIWLLLYFFICFTNIEVNKIVVVNEHFSYETFNLQKIKILQGKEDCNINTNQDEITVGNLLRQSQDDEEFSFYLSKIRKYLISCFVICVVQLASGIVRDTIFLQREFEISFFDNAIITLGNCIPFIVIYLLILRFVFIYCRRRENM